MYSTLLLLYNVNIFILLFIFVLTISLICFNLLIYFDVYTVSFSFHFYQVEYVWTLLPFLLTLFLTYLLTLSFNSLVISAYLTIYVWAAQWYWNLPFIETFLHSHIYFVVTSNDVLHGFSIPLLGLKIDAIPGVLNSVTTYLPMSGLYYGFCTELCGVHHSQMPFQIHSPEFLI